MRVDRSDPDAVLRRYYLFRAMAAVGFIAPVFALFVLRDLSYAAYGALSALYSLLLVGGEVPTGYVADRLGRRDTLVASKVALAASLFGFLAVDSFGSYLVVYVVWGVGMALTSGTGSAWLYEVLESTVGGEEFTRVRGRGNAVARWSAAVTTILGSILYTADPRYPFIAAGTLMLAGAGVVATLPRIEQFETGAGGPEPREAVALLRDRIARPPLRSFVLFVALLFAIAGAGNQYIQPAAVAVADDVAIEGLPLVGGALDTVRGALGSVAVADVDATAATGLGPLYASFAAVGAGLSYYADRVERAVGLRGALVGVAAVLTVTFLAPLAVPVAAVAAFYASQGVAHLLRPMVEAHVNDHTGDAGRATVLSAVSMVLGLARTPFVVLAGLAAGAWGPVAAFGALAGLFVALAVPLALLGSPFASGQSESGAAAAQ